jgi:uncharacterized membrane protein YgcG
MTNGCEHKRRGVGLMATSALLAMAVLATGCDEDASGACVTHNKTRSVYFCFEDKSESMCQADSSSSSDTFHEDRSCGSAGYSHWCTTTKMEKHGLSGASRYLSNSGCDPRIPAGGGSSSGGGSSGGGSAQQCESAWTCAYDGQATPTCQWACTHPAGSSERAQSCKVLASMLTSGNACR